MSPHIEREWNYLDTPTIPVGMSVSDYRVMRAAPTANPARRVTGFSTCLLLCGRSLLQPGPRRGEEALQR